MYCHYYCIYLQGIEPNSRIITQFIRGVRILSHTGILLYCCTECSPVLYKAYIPICSPSLSIVETLKKQETFKVDETMETEPQSTQALVLHGAKDLRLVCIPSQSPKQEEKHTD